ncbi:hypothetical protein GPALN_010450 [Globodera pallida]|nr:hypothetical protein GPALN_010450 [Globodera pallida]
MAKCKTLRSLNRLALRPEEGGQPREFAGFLRGELGKAEPRFIGAGGQLCPVPKEEVSAAMQRFLVWLEEAERSLGAQRLAAECFNAFIMPEEVRAKFNERLATAHIGTEEGFISFLEEIIQNHLMI